MTTPFPFVSGAVLTAAQLNAITTLPINAKTASYTLVVGDVGQRVQMTSASSTTITVNTGIFAAGDTIWIQNLGAGTCTITAGTATVSTASSLALAQYGGGTLVFQSASAATFFSGGGASYGTATGGTSLTPWTTGGFTYSGTKFTTDGTLTVTKAGLFDVCLIGGGGGGSRGGGGAGGLLIQTIYLAATTFSVDVGAGGSVAATFADGYESTIGGVIGSPNIAACGGGSYSSSHNTGYGNQAASASTVTAQNQSQGKNGGAGSGTNGGGGGGGAGSIGSNGSGSAGGNGGTGYDITAFNSNTSLFVCGGGAGGGTTTGGTGGSSSGGNGGVNGSPAAQSGVANTGGGGGGIGQGTGTSGDGGAGAVYIRWR